RLLFTATSRSAQYERTTKHNQGISSHQIFQCQCSCQSNQTRTEGRNEWKRAEEWGEIGRSEEGHISMCPRAAGGSRASAQFAQCPLIGD
ncbi:Serine/threonine-protein kinase ssp1, partial [Dissostichus eleginoides]